MSVDAIILAGGRSSRLGGVAKASLLRDGRTLLQLAIDAARPAGGRVIVVGPEVETADPVRFVREHPVFGGPAAAVAAGLDALRDGVAAEGPVQVAVLACDMPDAAPALAAVLDAATATATATATAATRTDADGWVAVDDSGREQPLLAVYRREALERRVAALRASQPSGDLAGVSVRQLLAGLVLRQVPIPDGGSADVDTWADATGLGVVTAVESPAPTASTTPNADPEERLP
ncbi:Molybdopterin-guanine dinucleotide biosynthesis protein A [Plantibacter flavus]|uniref:Molybdopterin-guanine dinucleotide biosynthesis protein A n=1 Tax=Plantibacter flavus TaxID=150123 RepID=A0A3N2C760_9MICO|nr:NTP transferase domain-containing protein [Plantibacter flavus]ROR83351.1 molybdopterin-guanine dinucleotide biosynthesis protein A [Plantibacter flavus]SMG22819.1 Molybdopterin-guanine dinucleotide biosynthesis protein A [Plantibacter flavus]